MEDRVKAHYSTGQLKRAIFNVIENLQSQNKPIELKTFAPIDQLHLGGAPATIDLLKKVGLKPGSKVLDAGCGIGGSSRLMVNTFDCIVTGIDLSDEFINTAREITRLFFKEDQISFHKGSVLELPFDDLSFDAVLCQHVMMNINDKKNLCNEFYRVLRKGGKLILHEIVKGEKEPVKYPVPWAAHGEISFLSTWESIMGNMKNAGFEKQFYSDWTQTAVEWSEKVKVFSQKLRNTRPMLGPHLVFGENASLFPGNMNYNLKQNRIKVVEALLKK